MSFADKIWRIVRVNGDGTIRLILDGNTGVEKEFTDSPNGHKYVGYTYDNDHACTKANPCTSESGTNSTIKNYLENEWYATNLVAYEDKIALGSYCNDTVYTTNVINGTTYRDYTSNKNAYKNKTPSLKCGDTNETYGGYYKLKIGLLTADEMMLAGLQKWSEAPKTNYLYHDYPWLSFSPVDSSPSSSNLLTGAYGYIDNVSSINAVHPVINLKADTVVTSGDGTKNSPYVAG